MVRAHLFISGRVQGVFYRATTLQEARARGLSGWVRNLHDGRVEAMVQGPREKVESLIQWCYKGPSGASVSGIDVEYGDPDDTLGEFDIR